MDVDSCMARLAQVMNDNEPALIAARAERFAVKSYTTVSYWAWTRVIRTRMFLVRNGHVAMRKLPRFQGQTL